MEKAKKFGAVDIAKYISALLVVAIHTYPFVEISEVFNSLFIAIVCRLAVPFFFVCSGYFFFRKVDPDKKKQGRKHLFHYLKRLGILYLVWTVIYLPYTIWNYAASGFTVFSLLGYIRDFFLNGSYYHLWFLPALILGTWIVYRLYLSRGLKRTLLVGAVLYLIGYLINVYAMLWEHFPIIDILYGFFTNTIGTARDGIFFAPIFVGLGALLAKAKMPTLKHSAIGFGISFACLILEVSLYYGLGILYDKACMFLSLVPAVYFLCSLLLQWDIPYKPVYQELRQDSTLIYVSHILFARILLMMIPDAHLVVYLGTLSLAQLFAYIVIRAKSRFPWLAWLM